MRRKDPELMKKICHYAEQYYFQNGMSPSTTKIAEKMGIARGTAYKYLSAMREKGMIEYDGAQIRTDLTKKVNTESSRTAILGSVPCGLPQYEEEHIEEYISLPTAIFGRGEFYLLRASGDSMVEAGIEDGDLVVIRKKSSAKDGDIVVALVNGQNTLKTFYRDEEGRKVRLHPENKEMEDILVDACYIQGVACHVIKAL